MTRASRWVLAAAIAGSALAVGTAHTVTHVHRDRGPGGGGGAGVVGGGADEGPVGGDAALVHGDRVDAHTTLQCVPMPIGWLAVIAPHNADVWSRALAPLRIASQFCAEPSIHNQVNLPPKFIRSPA
jgi:hypothetical protein